jgi:parallel beta-helix repeat protein
LTAINTLVSGNSGGDGIGAGSSSAISLADCTITGNGSGGVSLQGTSTISNCTISGNSNGVGVTNNGTMVLTNDIIAGNLNGSSEADVSGAVSGSNNLIGVSTGMTGITNGTNGNLVGASASPLNPHLNTLSNNGGPTKTMSEQAGSPAIGSGGALSTIAVAVADTTTTTIAVADLNGFAATYLPPAPLLRFLFHDPDRQRTNDRNWRKRYHAHRGSRRQWHYRRFP